MTAEIKQLRRDRRRAATAAMGSGLKATYGWHDLEAIEHKLGEIDPDGDWRYEARNQKTGKWEIQR